MSERFTLWAGQIIPLMLMACAAIMFVIVGGVLLSNVLPSVSGPFIIAAAVSFDLWTVCEYSKQLDLIESQ